jgi:hypothetical protein
MAITNSDLASYVNPGSLIALFSITMFLIVWFRNRKFPSSSKIIYSFVSGTIIYGIIASIYFILTGEFVFGDKNQYKLMAGLSTLIYLWLFANELKTLVHKTPEEEAEESETEKIKELRIEKKKELKFHDQK